MPSWISSALMGAVAASLTFLLLGWLVWRPQLRRLRRAVLHARSTLAHAAPQNQRPGNPLAAAAMCLDLSSRELATSRHREDQLSQETEEASHALGEVTTHLKRTLLELRKASLGECEDRATFAACTREASSSAAEALTTAGACLSLIEKLQIEGKGAQRSFQNTAGNISEIAKRAEETGSILEFMRGVAEETNLLALNAAIVSAQVGPEGRGFSLVAEEIRELSERMSSCVKELAGLVASLREGVNTVRASLIRGEEQSPTGGELIERVASDIGRLVGTVAHTVASLERTSPLLCPNRGAPEAATEPEHLLEDTISFIEEVGRCLDCHFDEHAAGGRPPAAPPAEAPADQEPALPAIR